MSYLVSHSPKNQIFLNKSGSLNNLKFLVKDMCKIKNFKTVIKGDQKIKCISAASIVAKVFRDLYMIKLGNKFPQYNWQKNFGYGTLQHLNALKKFGISNYHRKSYRPVHNILSK